MPDWLARLTRRARPAPASALPQALAHYPPYVAPHAGPPGRLARAQADENLAHLLAHLDQRLAALSTLLHDFGIDPAPALAGADPGPLLDALHGWAQAEWRATHDAELAVLGRWLGSPRSGREIVFSLLLDVALLLGELVRRRDPRWEWALDLDPANRRDGMPSAMRPVLLRRDPDHVKLMDLEATVIERWRHPDDVGNALNEWRRIVRDATAG